MKDIVETVPACTTVMDFLDIDRWELRPSPVPQQTIQECSPVEYRFEQYDTDPGRYYQDVCPVDNPEVFVDILSSPNLQNGHISMQDLVDDVGALNVNLPDDGTATPMLPVSWEELSHLRPGRLLQPSQETGLLKTPELINFSDGKHTNERGKRQKRVSFSDVETILDAGEEFPNLPEETIWSEQAETDDYKAEMAEKMSAKQSYADFNNLKQFRKIRKPGASTKNKPKIQNKTSLRSSKEGDTDSNKLKIQTQAAKDNVVSGIAEKQTTQGNQRRRKRAPSTLQLPQLNNIGDYMSINYDKQLTDSSIDDSSEYSFDNVSHPGGSFNLSPEYSSSSDSAMDGLRTEPVKAETGTLSKQTQGLVMPSTMPTSISSSEMGNMLDPKGNTMVHLAAATGNLDCLRLLSSKCEELLSQCNDLDQTPTEVAIVNGRAKCLNWLLCNTAACNELYPSHDHARCLLHLACAVGHVNCLYTLLTLMQTEDMSLECVDQDGNTPAHMAAKNGHLGCLQTLVEFNMDVTMENYSGKSPCNFADDSSHYHCVNYLIVVESCMQLSSEVSESANEVRALREENASLKGYLEECLEINNILLNQQQHKESDRQTSSKAMQSDVRNLLGDIVSQLQGLLVNHRNLLEKAERGASQTEQQHQRVYDVLEKAEQLTEHMKTPRKESESEQQPQPKPVDEGTRRMRSIEQRIRQMSRDPSPVTTEYSETKELMRRKFNEVSHRLMVFHTAIKERHDTKTPHSAFTPPQTPNKPGTYSALPSPTTSYRFNTQATSTSHVGAVDLRAKLVNITEENPNDEELRKRRLNQSNLTNGHRVDVVERVSGPQRESTAGQKNAREFAVVMKNGKIDVRTNGTVSENRTGDTSATESRVDPARLTSTKSKCDSDTNSESTKSLENELRQDREKELANSPHFKTIVAKFETDGFPGEHGLVTKTNSAPNSQVKPPIPLKRPPPKYSPRTSTSSDGQSQIQPKSLFQSADGNIPLKRPYPKCSPRTSTSSDGQTQMQSKSLFQCADGDSIMIQHDDDSTEITPTKPRLHNHGSDRNHESLSKMDDGKKKGLLSTPSGQSVVQYLNKMSPRAMVGTGPMIQTPNKQRSLQMLSPFKIGAQDRVMCAANGHGGHLLRSFRMSGSAEQRLNGTNPPRSAPMNGIGEQRPNGLSNGAVTNASHAAPTSQYKGGKYPITTSKLPNELPLSNSLPIGVYGDTVSLGEDSVFEGSTGDRSWYDYSSDEGC